MLLEGQCEGLDFWAQPQSVEALKKRLIDEVGGDAVTSEVEEEPLPLKGLAVRRKGRLMSGHKEVSASTPEDTSRRATSIRVDVKLDELHVRTETPFGLYETATGRALFIRVDM